MKYYQINTKNIIDTVPLDETTIHSIAESRRAINSILSGKDSRFILVVGPCALQSKKSAIAYAQKLKKLQEAVTSSFFLVMRSYYEKARSYNSWKGIAYPEIAVSTDTSYNESLIETRKILQAIAQIGVPLGAEIIDPIAALFFQDLLSWSSIGARTTSSQIHRLFASSLPMACGIKNTIDGSIIAATAAIEIANKPQIFLGATPSGTIGWIESDGNPHAHLILRGSEQKTNYQSSEIEIARALLAEKNLNQSIIVDCSHGNSRGDVQHQKQVLQEVLQKWLIQENQTVRGFMIESFLEKGTIRDRDLTSLSEEERELLMERTSWVDPCLGWNETERLIYEAHNIIQKR